MGIISDGRGIIHFCGFEAWLLYSIFKWGAFIQNHVIEACPNPKAEKWGTTFIHLLQMRKSVIHAEACYYSIATNEAWHYSNTPNEAKRLPRKWRINATNWVPTHCISKEAFWERYKPGTHPTVYSLYLKRGLLRTHCIWKEDIWQNRDPSTLHTEWVPS